MADIQIARPEAGANVSLPAEQGAKFVLNFDAGEGQFVHEGDNLVLNFPDEGKVTIENFYTTYNAENPVNFSVNGVDVSSEDFFAALNLPDLNPAAGPGAGTTATATLNGGRYRDYTNMALADGLDHLTRLDYNSNRGFEWENSDWITRPDADYGLYGLQAGAAARTPSAPEGRPNNPVTITPATPWLPDANIPEADGAGNPYNPDAGNMAPGMPVSSVKVSEKNIGTADGIQEESFIINAPDGVATISIGDRVVYENGNLVPEADRTFYTDEGKLTVTGFDPDTGRLTYTFEITSPSGEHSKPGEDSISHTFKVTVTDPDGDSDSNYITVIVEDDVPVAADDFNSIDREATTPVTGDLLANDDFGADGRHADSYVELTSPAEGEYGTLTLNPDGTYSFVLNNENPDVAGLKKGETLTQEFTYKIIDKDGDESEATLTITINGNQPVSITPIPGVNPDPGTDPVPGTPSDPGTNPDPGTDPNPGSGPDPDENGYAVGVNGAILTVNDSGLKGGSEQGTANTRAQGVFDIDAKDGVGSITVTDASGTAYNVVVNGVFTPTSIATAEGVLSFTSFDPATGKLSYEFVLQSPGEHPANDQLSHDFKVTVTDKDGDSASSNITVVIKDDAPKAENDVNEVFRDKDGNTEAIFGNVLVNDKFGADGPNDNSQVELTGNGQGQFGTLTLNPDGSYSYQLNDANADVAGLKNGESLTETFTYQITDKDGDTSEATLTITINGNQPVTITPGPDPDPDPEPGTDPDPDDSGYSVGANGGILTVNDSGLKGGSEQGTANTRAEGVFDIDAKDGVANITITSPDGAAQYNVVVNGVFTATSIHTSEGVLNITDFDPATGKLSYEFVLEHAGRHPENDQLSHDFKVTVTDKDGDSASSNITVIIRDDDPNAVNDNKSIKENETVDGNVLVNDSHGADGTGTFADGATVKWVLPDGAERVEDANGVPCYKVVLAEGTALLYDNGKYSFTANGVETDTAVSFDYMIVDADGDTSKATLTIDIANVVPSIVPDPDPDVPDTPNPDPDDPDPDPTPDPDGEPIKPGMEISHATVDEAKLETGSGEGDGTATVINKFAVNTHGEGGTLTFTLGGQSISFALDSTDSYKGEPLTITTDQGSFTVNYIINGVVQYTYTLTATDLDPNGAAGRDIHDQAQQIQVDLVDNVGGDKTNGVINVNIVDDVPVVKENISFADSKTDDAGHEYVDDTASEISGQLNGLVFGADSDGAKVEFTVTVNGVEKSYEGKVTGSGDKISIEFGDAPVVLNPDGSFTLTRGDEAKDGESDKYEINVTITDRDGDQTHANGAIFTNVEPGIVPDPTPDPDPDNPDPDPDSVPDPKPDDPKIDDGELISQVTVDEAGLATGSHKGDGSDTVSHKFAINTHGEGGTLTFTLGGQSISFAVDTNDTYQGNAQTITTTQGIFTVNSIQNGVVSYTYTLGSTDMKPLGGTDRDIHNQAQQIQVELVDNIDANTTNGVINVNIVDDVPVVDESISFKNTIENDGNLYVADTVSTISGQLTGLKFGADSDGSTVEVTITTNGEAAIYTGTVSGTSATGITIDFGNAAPITMDANGNFTFTRPSGVDNNISDKYEISATITDKDGDQTHASGTILTHVKPGIVPDPAPDTPDPDPDDPDPDPDPDPQPEPNPDGDPIKPALDAEISHVTMDESKLDIGSQGGEGVKTFTNSFAINTHGEGGTITFTIEGYGPISLAVNKYDSYEDDPLSIETNQGIFTVNSIANGIVSYTYTLTAPDLEPDTDQNGDNIRGTHDKAQQIKVELVDNIGGDKSYGVINVNIIDDVPVVESLGVTSDQLIANNIIGDDTIFFDDTADTIEGVIKGLSIGADREGATVKLSLHDADGKETSYRIYDVSFDENGNVVLTAHDGGDVNLTLNDLQSFSYKRPSEHVGDEAEKSDTYNFKLTVTDSDGDVVSVPATIVSNYTPDFTPPSSDENPNPEPVEQPDPKDPNAPIANVVEIKVHESDLVGGTARHPDNPENDPSAQQTGYFTVDTHHEGGTLVLSWVNGQSIEINLDASNSWTDGAGQPKSMILKGTVKDEHGKIETVQVGTFTVESIENGRVSYSFILDKASNNSKENGWDALLQEPIKMELKDTLNNDVAHANIKVTVVDDGIAWHDPVYKPTAAGLTPVDEMHHAHIDFSQVTGSGSTNALFDQIGFHTAMHFTNDYAGYTTKESDRPNVTSTLKAYNGHVEIYATMLHYKYLDVEKGELQVENAVDITTAIKNTARVLHLTGNGITVGSENHESAWNGGKTPGEISVSAGTNQSYKLVNSSGGTNSFKNVYGQNADINVDNDNVSEAVNFNIDFIAYGFKIDLGDSMQDGDRALVTFMLTPEHNSDDTIVKTMVLTTGGLHTIEVPEGFTKVFVSALPKGDQYTTKPGGMEVEGDATGSGFIIKEVDFLQPSHVSSGQVQAISADGIASYDWNWTQLKANGNDVEVLVKGQRGGKYSLNRDQGHMVDEGDYAGMTKYTFTIGKNVEGQEVSGITGETLFIAYINKQTGEWAVEHKREFDMLDETVRPFQIIATDGDGDQSIKELHVKPQFMRFQEVMDGHYNENWKEDDVVSKDQSDDILVGKDDHSLIFGKGGNDMLIGDEYDKLVNIDSRDTIVDNIADRIINAETGKDLNRVDASGNSTINEPTKVDKLYSDIDGLTTEKKILLGNELERHEKDYSGNDALYGGAKEDLLFGGAGNDYLSGDAGSDIIYAGGGHDIIAHDSADSFVDGGSGIDVMLAAKGTSLNDLLSNKVANVEMLLSSESKFISNIKVNSPDNLAEKGILISNGMVELTEQWTFVKTEHDINYYENENNGNKLTLQIKVGANIGKGNKVQTLNINDDATRTVQDQMEAAKGRMAMASAAAAEIGMVTALATAGTVDAAPRSVAELSDDAAEPVKQDASSAYSVSRSAVAEVEEQSDSPTTHADEMGYTLPDEAFDEFENIDYVQLTANSHESQVKASEPVEVKASRTMEEAPNNEDQSQTDTAPTSGTDTGETVYGTEGDDIIFSQEGSDTILAGAGNDIIIYDPSDYLIDGGEGIDFLIADSSAESLDTLLQNGLSENAEGTMVRDVEVMIKGIDYTNLQSMDELASRLGFSFGKDANGNDTLILDASKWEARESDGNTSTFTMKGNESITLETTLEAASSEDAAQTITLVLQNGDQ